MASYNYVFGSLRDEQTIAEIPLFGVYMDLELNTGGRFDGTFSLDMANKNNADLMAATIPGKSWVCCERDGEPIWIGYIWSRTYQSQAKTVQLFAESFEKYPWHQLVRKNYNNLFDEQLVLFRTLWQDMLAVPGRNVNIIVPTGSLPTVTQKQLNVLSSDLKWHGEVMSELADSDTGFDWTVDVTRDGSRYLKTLRFGYPRLGAIDPNLITFDYPGSILNYYATESMSDAGTNVFVLGQGEGDESLIGSSTRDDMIAQGWPRWDVVVSRKDISSQQAVSDAAVNEAALRKPPRLVLKPSMKADKVPSFGSFSLGDACTLAIFDPRFPNGLSFTSRIVKWTLSPQSTENSDEFSLIFAGDEDV